MCIRDRLYTESLRPRQIHSHYKSIIPSLTWIPFIPLLNLHQTAHPNLPPPSTSRCLSMMVSIIEIVLYTKLTAEHQYLLRSSSHPLQNKRAFPFSLALRIRRICFFNETHNLSLLNQEIQGVHIYYHTLSLKRLTHAYSSSFRIPPSHSLNIIYISQARLHSLILPTLCYLV